MALTDYVTLSITQNTVGLTRAGFGTGLLLSYNAAWAERTRTYTQLSDVATDFPIVTGPEYLAASAYFSQSPAPTSLIIGRGALKPQKTVQLSAISPTGSALYPYLLNVKGEGVTSTQVTFTSDASPTDAEWAAGMVTALNAVVGKNFTADGAASPISVRGTNALVVADIAFTAAAATEIFTSTAHGMQTGDGPVWLSSGGAMPSGVAASTDYFVIRIDADTYYLATTRANALAGTNLLIATDGSGTLADVASTTRLTTGEWFSLEILDVNHMKQTEVTTDPGVATDLTAITAENPDWYGLMTTYNSVLYGHAAAAYVESANKIYVLDSSDTNTVLTAVTNGDAIDDLKTNAYARTLGMYHPNPASMAAAALLGKCLPFDPGSETWAFKTLAGVPTYTMTATHRANIVARNGNGYELVAGLNMTFQGKTGDGGYLDTTRGLDWLRDDMSKAVFGALVGASKIPYTDPGIAVIESQVRGSLKRAADRGILVLSSLVVTVPTAASCSTADKTSRTLNNVKFSATLQGAIHKANIVGVVSA